MVTKCAANMSVHEDTIDVYFLSLFLFVLSVTCTTVVQLEKMLLERMCHHINV